MKSNGRQITAECTQEGLILNGELVGDRQPLDRFRKLLGSPAYVDECLAPPAPAGHRNNQRHVYDDCGIFLLEHHATGLIQLISFVFDPMESLLPIHGRFDGRLRILAQAVEPGMTESELPDSFRRHLAGRWYSDLEGVSVDMQFTSRKRVDGKRSCVRRLVEVAVGFR